MKNCFPQLNEYNPDHYDSMKQSVETVGKLNTRKSEESTFIKLNRIHIKNQDYTSMREKDEVSSEMMKLLCSCIFNSSALPGIDVHVVNVKEWDVDGKSISIKEIFMVKDYLEGNNEKESQRQSSRSTNTLQTMTVILYRSSWYLIITNINQKISIFLGQDSFPNPSQFSHFCVAVLKTIGTKSKMNQTTEMVDCCGNNGLVVFGKLCGVLGIKAEYQNTWYRYKRVALWAVHSIFILNRFEEIKSDMDKKSSNSSKQSESTLVMSYNENKIIGRNEPAVVGAQEDTENSGILKGLNRSSFMKKNRNSRSIINKSEMTNKGSRLPLIRKADARLGPDKNPGHIGEYASGARPFYGFRRDFSSSDNSERHDDNIKNQLNLGTPGNPIILSNPVHYNNHLAGTSPIMLGYPQNPPPMGSQYVRYPQKPIKHKQEPLPSIHQSNYMMKKIPSFSSSSYSSLTFKKKKKRKSSDSNSPDPSEKKPKKNKKVREVEVPDVNIDLEEELTEVEQKYALSKPGETVGVGRRNANGDQNAINQKIKNYLDEMNEDYHVVKFEIGRMDQLSALNNKGGDILHQSNLINQSGGVIGGEGINPRSSLNRFAPKEEKSKVNEKDSDDERMDEYKKQKQEFEIQREIIIRKNKRIKEENLKRKINAKDKMTNKLENINKLMV